jgi:NAD(P)H-dependent flavin oxidoreductase YrpB (nitropropane dioxygenase family)
MDEWGGKREEARRERERLWAEIQAKTQAGRRHEVLLTAGQSAGGINALLSVGDILRQLVRETEEALAKARKPPLLSH